MNGSAAKAWRAVAVLAVAAATACAPGREEVATSEAVVAPAITAGRLAPADARAWLATSDLVYVSDYLSFVGRDAAGFVALVLDTNRGRDGKEHQAEHYVAMHDQRRGWIDVAGAGIYDNPRGELVGLPDSPFFRFGGDVAGGLAVASPPNGLTLEVAPVEPRLVEHDERTVFALGSAPATLRWDGRAIPGRVIHEGLAKTAFNMMTRPDVSGLKNFNGFYLLTGEGGDLYLHGVEGTGAAVPSPLLGFRVEGGRGEVMRDLRVEETGHRPGMGLYRWPTSWTVAWQGSGGPATLELAMLSRKGMVNWVLGGYSLAMVSGELREAGRTTPVYGWAELIR